MKSRLGGGWGWQLLREAGMESLRGGGGFQRSSGLGVNRQKAKEATEECAASEGYTLSRHVQPLRVMPAAL